MKRLTDQQFMIIGMSTLTVGLAALAVLVPTVMSQQLAVERASASAPAPPAIVVATTETPEVTTSAPVETYETPSSTSAPSTTTSATGSSSTADSSKFSDCAVNIEHILDATGSTASMTGDPAMLSAAIAEDQAQVNSQYGATSGEAKAYRAGARTLLDRERWKQAHPTTRPSEDHTPTAAAVEEQCQEAYGGR